MKLMEMDQNTNIDPILFIIDGMSNIKVVGDIFMCDWSGYPI